MKEKFKYFMKVEKELYDIIDDAINLDIKTIVKMLNKHINSYNAKNNLYRFSFMIMTEPNDVYKFNISEKQSYTWKPIYSDIIPLKEIIRNKKIDSLLG